jgi:hypothetical protein
MRSLPLRFLLGFLAILRPDPFRSAQAAAFGIGGRDLGRKMNYESTIVNDVGY